MQPIESRLAWQHMMVGGTDSGMTEEDSKWHDDTRTDGGWPLRQRTLNC